MTSTSSSQEKRPLPLADILRDLAILRASELDLADVVPDGEGTGTESETAETNVTTAVKRSYEFAKEARAALRIQRRGELGRAGENVDRVREGFESILKGLEGSS